MGLRAAIFSVAVATAAEASRPPGAPPPIPGLPYFVAAADAGGVTLTGRWVVNATDGSAFGDWEGISATVTVNNTPITFSAITGLSTGFTTLTALIEDGCIGNKVAVTMSGNGGSENLRVSTL
jgi:hypothetical protein